MEVAAAAGKPGPAEFSTDALAAGLNRSTSRVVAVGDPDAMKDYTVRPAAVRRMVDKGLRRWTGAVTVAEAWQSLVGTNEVIGIKVFAAPDGMAGTRLATVAALVEGLLEAGCPPANVIVWDRQMNDLQLRGFTDLTQRFGIRVEAAAAAGYDENVYYESPLIGQLIWGDREFGEKGDDIGKRSYVSRLVSREITRLITVSPALNHNRAGTAGHLYSLALGSVDNTIRFQSDAERLAVAVPEIFALPKLADRTVLHVTDALICQFAGESRGLLHYSAALNELRFSTDPVALDVLVLEDIQRLRGEAGMKPARQNRELYANATLLQLGTSDPAKILVERPSELPTKTPRNNP